MRKTLLMLVFMLALFLSGSALAIDYWGNPPDGTWLRGAPGTTFQHWDFIDPGWPGPDIWDNPYGDPFFDLDPPTGWDWGEWECPPELNPNGFVTGWHCSDQGGGSITLTIPNSDDPEGAKWMFIQMTSSKAPSDVTVSGSGSNPSGYTSGTWSTGRPHIQWPGAAPFGGQWYTYNFGRWIQPNPQSETITIEVPYCTVVDQIVVDTICTRDPVADEDSSWSRVKALFR
jgi:hypothetical protein